MFNLNWLHLQRYTVINNFIKARNYNSYLEVGVEIKHCFDKIECENKECVDINHPATYQLSSDDFFLQNKKKYDLIFIDACHDEKQVDKDIINSLNALNQNGVIVLHDCLPTTLEYEQLHFCGTVWKSFTKFRLLSMFKTYCITADYGLGIIDTKYKLNISSDKVNNIDYNNLKFEDLELHHKVFLNTISNIDSSIYE